MELDRGTAASERDQCAATWERTREGPVNLGAGPGNLGAGPELFHVGNRPLAGFVLHHYLDGFADAAS